MESKVNNIDKKTQTLEISDIVTECALDIPGNVCSTDKTVNAMREHLVKKKIDTKSLKTPTSVVDTIKKNLKCSTEECVLTNDEFARPDIKQMINESLDRIKPPGPANDTSLLNNNNIDTVLHKLTKLHIDFYHMYFQMIDFAGEKTSNGEWVVSHNTKITPTRLGTIDMSKDVIDKGFKTFGVVMNTDKRTGGGIHWFSLFCDFRKNPCTVEYFNSSGNKPVKQIQEWLIKTGDNLNTNGYTSTVDILSGLVHQKDSETECGLYSIYYIWNRINGVPSQNFQKTRIPDAEMIKLRKQCFKSG